MRMDEPEHLGGKQFGASRQIPRDVVRPAIELRIEGRVTDLWLAGNRIFHSEEPVVGLTLRVEEVQTMERYSLTWYEV